MVVVCAKKCIHVQMLSFLFHSCDAHPNFTPSSSFCCFLCTHTKTYLYITGENHLHSVITKVSLLLSARMRKRGRLDKEWRWKGGQKKTEKSKYGWKERFGNNRVKNSKSWKASSLFLPLTIPYWNKVGLNFRGKYFSYFLFVSHWCKKSFLATLCEV